MKTLILIFFCILVVCFSSNIFAQGEAAVPFLLLDASPNLTGMAGTAVALPTTDVYGAWYNPAQLGNFSRTNNLGIGIYPVKSEWLPSLNFSDMTWHSMAASFGHTFNNEFPINVGFSYIYSKLDLGENVWTDATGIDLGVFNSFESSNTLSIGAGIDYFAQINVGLSYKYISSEINPTNIYIGSEVRGAKATVSAFDFGVLVIFPVFELFELNNETKFFDNIIPFFNISTGYSLLNIGDKVTYINEDQADPLPRQAKLGYGLTLGLKHELEGNTINIIKFDFSSEARDLLIIRSRSLDTLYTGPNFEYENIMGEINVIDNVILGKADKNVANYNGWKIKIFDTFQYSKGYINYYKLRGYSGAESTSGFLLSSSGLMKWLSSKSTNENLKYIAKHFSLEYCWSGYNSENEENDLSYKGIQLKMFGYW